MNEKLTPFASFLFLLQLRNFNLVHFLLLQFVKTNLIFKNKKKTKMKKILFSFFF